MPVNPLTPLQDIVPERSTCRITLALKDETDAAVGSSQITTFRMTLLVASTTTVINTQENINILNSNQGTVDGSGNVVLTLTPADNQIVGSAREQWHRVQLEWTYGVGGAKTGRAQIDYLVRNFDRVP